MSGLSFEDVAVEVPADAAPETTDDGHYCQEPGCTNETFRNGDRGRWPKFCDEHKKTRSGASSSSTAKRAAPAQAKQAATVLSQFNDLLSVALYTVSMVPQIPLDLTHTASALANVNEQFAVQAEQALSTDPALCRAILRVGKAGGRTALVMAYVSLGIGLAPAVTADIAAMREGRHAAHSE